MGQPARWGCSREPSFSGAVNLFNSVCNLRNIAIRGLHEICMVEGHTQIERGKRVACWSDFPLHGVYRFKSLRLSYMSITHLWQSSCR
jgi:hypothetical protein